MYIAGKPFYDVRTAEKGTCRFRLRARGEPGHGSVPRQTTAVSRLAEAVLKLAATPLPFRPTTTVAALFELLCEALEVPRDRRRFTEQNFQRLLQLLPTDFAQYLHAVAHDTAVPTGLRSGHKINVIPSEAEASVDGRYLPGQTAEGFLQEIRGVIGDDYEIEPLDLSLPLEDPPDGPLFETIVSVLAAFAPEATILPITLAGATDAKHVSRLGTKCLGFSPLRVSEGFPIEQLVHGHDERIPIAGFSWGIQVLYEIVTRFCG
jgi:acetylornithine deacetylase/succinyl-diaminopimelate desuccinylase-like protein